MHSEWELKIYGEQFSIVTTPKYILTSKGPLPRHLILGKFHLLKDMDPYGQDPVHKDGVVLLLLEEAACLFPFP